MKRYLDPKENKLHLDKYHRTVQQKKSVSQRVRDIKRVIAKVKENDAPVKVEKIEELKQLNKVRRDSRKIKFVDQKYKQVKFYGSLC